MADAPEPITGSGPQQITASGPPLAPSWELPHSERDEPYTPLSLLAVAGLALSVLYAVLVAIGGVVAFGSRHPVLLMLLIVVAPLISVVLAAGARVRGSGLARVAGLALLALFGFVGVAGLVAFSGSNPWVLPGWTLCIPIATACLCLAARVLIRGSEGTLAGAPLANAGLVLSVSFGLVYTAYLAAGTFAVRQQAADFTSTWLQLLRDGQTNRAFLLTLPPSSRLPPDTPDLRNMLESTFNMPRGPAESGQYSTFTRSPFVRLLQVKQVDPNSDVQIELESVSPEFDQGVYRVVCRYMITTEYSRFRLQIMAVGTESGKAGAVREWQILLDQTGMPENPENTPVGEEMSAMANAAAQCRAEFVEAAGKRDIDRMYRLSLPPEERKRYEEREAAGLPGGVAALAGGAGVSLLDRQAFIEGRLVQATDFWSLKDVRQEALAGVKDIFRPDSARPPQFQHQVMRRDLPGVQRKGKRLTFRFPVNLMLFDPDGTPRYTAEGDVVVTAETDGALVPPEDWRVEAIDLTRAFTAPHAPRRGGP